MGCVYLAENTINKKCYIGKTTTSLKRRKGVHQSESKQPNPKRSFQKALRKYGFKNFEWMILYESENDKNLIKKEIYFIKKYKTKTPNGYNLTIGGQGMSGFIYSKEHNQKLSKALQKHPVSKETRKKISKSKKGKKYGNRILREVRKCKRQECNNKFEVRITSIKKYCSRSCANIRKDKKFKRHSEKANRETSKLLKKRWQNPEYRKKISKAIQKKWKDPEYREKQIKSRIGNQNARREKLKKG